MFVGVRGLIFHTCVYRTRLRPITRLREFHFSTAFRQIITRQQIENAPNVYNFVDTISVIPDVNEKYQKFSALIDNVKKFNNPTYKELVVLKSAHVCRGKVLLQMRKEKEAMKDIDIAESFNIGDARMYYEKGNLLAILGKYSSAIRYLTKAINDSPAGSKLNIEALVVRALCHWEVLEPVKARQDSNEVIFYEPDNIRARLERGRYYAVDNPKLSEEDFKFCSKSDIKEIRAEALFRLFIICGRLRKPNEAENAVKELTELDPQNPRLELIKKINAELEQQLKQRASEEEDMAQSPKNELTQILRDKVNNKNQDKNLDKEVEQSMSEFFKAMKTP